MKTEQGFVIEVSEGVAKVRASRHSDCKNCGACPGSNSIVVDADNKIGAKPGQRVAFEVKETNVVGAAFIVFILPLIALFIGVMLGGFLGQYIGANILVFQVIGGIAAGLISVIAVKLFDKAAKENKKNMPVIVRIL